MVFTQNQAHTVGVLSGVSAMFVIMGCPCSLSNRLSVFINTYNDFHEANLEDALWFTLAASTSQVSKKLLAQRMDSKSFHWPRFVHC